MKLSFFAIVMLLCSARASATQTDCGSPGGALVPDKATAGAIATAVIAARQAPAVSRRYRLSIEASTEGAEGWEVSQVLPQTRNRDPQTIVVTTGGGGLHMRIDRCTGAISDLHSQR